MVVIGIIGLFIGAVILALGYQLYQLWTEDTKEMLETAPQNKEKQNVCEFN
ncbi:hypothetical protein N9164_06035 [Draconibacterium sp.]|nr:hypothetical protein [Draconibacterium sp.]